MTLILSALSNLFYKIGSNPSYGGFHNIPQNIYCNINLKQIFKSDFFSEKVSLICRLV